MHLTLLLNNHMRRLLDRRQTRVKAQSSSRARLLLDGVAQACARCHPLLVHQLLVRHAQLLELLALTRQPVLQAVQVSLRRLSAFLTHMRKMRIRVLALWCSAGVWSATVQGMCDEL